MWWDSFKIYLISILLLFRRLITSQWKQDQKPKFEIITQTSITRCMNAWSFDPGFVRRFGMAPKFLLRHLKRNPRDNEIGAEYVDWSRMFDNWFPYQNYEIGSMGQNWTGRSNTPAVNPGMSCRWKMVAIEE